MNEIHPGMFDAALHSGARITIMTRLIIHRSMRFGALRKSSSLSDGNLATHLAVLEKAGYVTQEREERAVAPTKLIRVTDIGETAFRAYVQQLKSIVADFEKNPNIPAQS